jgi:hypothetical protein
MTYSKDELLEILAMQNAADQRMEYEQVETLQILADLGTDSLKAEDWCVAVADLCTELFESWHDYHELEDQLAQLQRERDALVTINQAQEREIKQLKAQVSHDG